jgi:pyruvate dehydrogenase E1 component
MEVVDGEYQTIKSKDGAYVREHFFNTPELKELVADYSDDDIWMLNRGGHDPFKVYAAYHAAVNHKGQPTVILAKTIKGYGMGESGEAQNITHQQKKLSHDSIKSFRDRFHIPVPDEALDEVPYVTFPDGSPELEYMRRGGRVWRHLPARRRAADAPRRSSPPERFKSTDEREISTTMAFVQVLQMLPRDKNIGKHIVPIVPDESRTFGMEGMFRQLGIWNQQGQLYTPEDSEQLMFYKESKSGQILQEGINEAGGMCDWIAAATSYSTHGVPMIPFYIFYSMFGFQRVGDLCGRWRHARAASCWAAPQAHDAERRGAAARTATHMSRPRFPTASMTRRSVRVAVIIHDGLRRVYRPAGPLPASR